MDIKKLELVKKLKTKDPTKLKMLIGFDGFVDEIIHVVDKRLDSEHFTRIDTIEEFAKRIDKASGLSTNIEFVTMHKKIGGNGPIMCNALSKHNADITYMGSLGYPTMNDVFLGLDDNVNIYTFADNGHTDAVEFYDGKLMLGKMSTLNDVTYERLIEVVGENKLINILNDIDLFATVNWSMLPHMTDIWKKLTKNILPKLKHKANKPYFFVDIADPEKRENVEIEEALNILKEFKTHFNVIIGINKKEAYEVANVLKLFDTESLENMQVSIEDLNVAIYNYLKIDAVVIHPVDRSSVVINNTFLEDLGPHIAKPKLTTGAGDNFNAGFILGMLLGLTPDEALITGMTTSGFYVRQARSPKFNELIDFLEEWNLDKL